MLIFLKAGVSNIRPGSQNWPCKDTLENVKECEDFELLTVFSGVEEQNKNKNHYKYRIVWMMELHELL